MIYQLFEGISLQSKLVDIKDTLANQSYKQKRIFKNSFQEEAEEMLRHCYQLEETGQIIAQNIQIKTYFPSQLEDQQINNLAINQHKHSWFNQVLSDEYFKNKNHFEITAQRTFKLHSIQQKLFHLADERKIIQILLKKRLKTLFHRNQQRSYEDDTDFSIQIYSFFEKVKYIKNVLVNFCIEMTTLITNFFRLFSQKTQIFNKSYEMVKNIDVKPNLEKQKLFSHNHFNQYLQENNFQPAEKKNNPPFYNNTLNYAYNKFAPRADILCKNHQDIFGEFSSKNPILLTKHEHTCQKQCNNHKNSQQTFQNNNFFLRNSIKSLDQKNRLYTNPDYRVYHSPKMNDRFNYKKYTASSSHKVFDV